MTIKIFCFALAFFAVKSVAPNLYKPLPPGYTYLQNPRQWFFTGKLQSSLLGLEYKTTQSPANETKYRDELVLLIKSEKYAKAQELLLKNRSSEWLNIAMLYHFLGEFKSAEALLNKLLDKSALYRRLTIIDFLYKNEHPLLCTTAKAMPRNADSLPVANYSDGLCALSKNDMGQLSFALNNIKNQYLSFRLAYLASDEHGQRILASAIPARDPQVLRKLPEDAGPADENPLKLFAYDALDDDAKEAFLAKHTKSENDYNWKTEYVQFLKNRGRNKEARNFKKESTAKWHNLDLDEDQDKDENPYKLKIR